MAPIFRDIYAILFLGYAIDSVSEMHELTELNGI